MFPLPHLTQSHRNLRCHTGFVEGVLWQAVISAPAGLRIAVDGIDARLSARRRGQAPQPRSGAPKAQSLTAAPPTEAYFVEPSSDAAWLCPSTTNH